MKILINPGHMPGVDPGAVNAEYNITEADTVKEIGELTASYLRKAGVECIVMQSDNICGESPNYPNVVALANNEDVDYVISIHCNSHANKSANGVECWVYPGSSKGTRIASTILNQIVNSLGMTNRGIKESSSLMILRHPNAPAVLVELGFISNDDDVEKLMYNKDDFARAIARGVTDLN